MLRRISIVSRIQIFSLTLFMKRILTTNESYRRMKEFGDFPFIT